MIETDVFSLGARTQLKALVGATWLGYGSDQLLSKTFALDELHIATSMGLVIFHSTVASRDFEGSDGDYSHLDLSVHSDKGLGVGDSPNVYFDFKGEIIQSVWLIQDMLQGYQDNHPTFTYTADAGIAFQLESGSICVARASHGSEGITVHTAPRISELTFSPLDARWHNGLEWTYTYDREWILLAGTGDESS